jgi:hypothetical protein
MLTNYYNEPIISKDPQLSETSVYTLVLKSNQGPS